MCELFTISSSTATEIRFSLNEFSKHGGLTNQHRHGWGIAYYSQNSAKITKETNRTMILPGLHVLQRKCQTTVIDTSIKGLTMAKKQAKNVILASSAPLNQENWIALESGQSMVFKNGEVVL